MSHLHGSCRSLLLALMCSACLSVGCGGPEAAPDPDLATVHGAVLAHLQARERQAGRAEKIFLVSQSRAVDSWLYATWPDDSKPPEWFLASMKGDWDEVQEMEGVTRALWDAFVANNRDERDLSEIVHYSGTIIWLSDEEKGQLFSEGADEGWRRVFRKYPEAGEITGMSMPGMSADGSRALIYVEDQAGGLSGSGDYYLLVCESGVWGVVAELTAWIS